jgi:hypothetical protein
MTVGRFTGWLSGVTLAVLLAGAAPASASTTLFVSAATGSNSAGCGSQAAPCLTISQAVTNASAGDTIQIAAGTYDEAVATGGKELNFVGAGTSGSGRTLIDASGTGSPALDMTDGGQVSQFEITTTDDGSVAFHVETAGTVDASHIAVTGAASDTAFNAEGSPHGSDAVSVGDGSTLNLSESTATAVNTDADIQDDSSCASVVADGSAVEAAGGTTNITASTLSAVRGIALRNRQPSGNTTLATAVSDSLIESSGTEDLATSCDGWQAIEAAAPTPLTLTGDTVYDATTAPAANGQPPADAITIEPAQGVSVVAHNTIFRAAAAGSGGWDVDADNGPLAADHSSYTATNTISSGTITPTSTAGNLAGDPGLTDPTAGDFALTAGSPLVGSADPSVATAGETDVTGAARTSTCAGGLTVLNIGAEESAAPPCPLAAPSPQPGGHTYGYVARTGGGTNAFAYEQFSVGAGGVLSQLSPFEAPSVSASGPGALLAGAASAQVYTFEHGALQQYEIESTGQLTPGATLDPPAGQTLGSAALTPDGHDLYVSFGAGSTETLAHYTVGASGALTAGGSTTLPAGTQGVGVAVDQQGRLYVLTGEGVGTSTLRDYRVNSDGTISQIDSLQVATSGGLVVAAKGSEAAIVVPNTDSSGSGSNGTIWPVAISATGVLSEPSTSNVPASGAGGGTSNIPTGATFSADGKTLYVTDEDEFANGGSIELYGSLVARFAVGAGGGLTAANSSPQATQGLAYDGGSALGPDATSLYIPDDRAFSGTVDQFNIAPDTSLAPKSPASVDSDTDQGAMVLVTPPAATTTTTTTTSATTTTSTRGGAGSPPPPASPGITGRVTFAAGGRGVPGATLTACGSNSSDCVTALSDGGGDYRLAVGSGTWLVTANPPTTTVLPASAYVEVPADDRATRSFALRAAVGLDHGVVFNTPDGPVGSGEPTVYWNQPFSFSVPAGAPGHHPANTTLLVSHFIGMGQNPSRAEAGLELAGIVLYGVHYGANGRPEGMTAPLVGTISCSADCAQLTDGGAGPPFGSPGLVVAPASDGASRIYTEAPNGNPVTLTVKGYTSPGLVRGPNPLAHTAVDIGPHPPGGAGGLAATVKDEMDQLTKDPAENGPDAANIDNGNDYVQADAESVGATTHGAEQWYDEGTDGVAGPQPPKGSDRGVTSYYPDAPKGYSAQDLASDAAAEQSVLPGTAADAAAAAQEEADINAYEEDSALADDQAADEDLFTGPGPGSVTEAVQQMEQNISKYPNTAAGVDQFLGDADEYLNSGSLTRAEGDDAYAQLTTFAQSRLPQGGAQINSGQDYYDDPGYYDPGDNSEGLVLSTSKYPDTDQGLSNLYNDAGAWAALHQLDGTQRLSLFATVDNFAKTYLPNATAAEQQLEDDDAAYYEGTDYLDPSGLVHAAHGIPLAGARVTLTRSATRHGRQVAVPSGSAIMSPGNRRNPSLTTVLGSFGWDTIPGYYRVSARHAGCRPASTTVFSVPPPRANLALALRCRAIHRRATRLALTVSRTRAGTLTVLATVKPARGRAPAGALLGVLTIRLTGQRAVALGVGARGPALVELYARRRTWRLTASFAGNGRYAPSSLRARGH